MSRLLPLAGPTPERPRRRPQLPASWRVRWDGGKLPGRDQRRRLCGAWLAGAVAFLLRPWPPFQWLPGWCIGLLLLWAITELVLWLWWPQRSA